MAQKLDDTAIEARLVEFPNWVRKRHCRPILERTFSFGDYVKAIAFVNEVAEAAEVAQHHPDILVRYSKVTLSLSTHDAGGITEKDFELAAVINGLHGD